MSNKKNDVHSMSAKRDKDGGRKSDGNDENRDPISGAPGAHPVGTGAGALGGAAAGAAIGTAVGGPVGTAVGGVIGAVSGGLAGKGVAEAINPTVEDGYWRENYKTRPYARAGTQYDQLQPAYRYGWESRSKNGDKDWKEVENDLESGWDKARGKSKMAWEDAKMATHDAWDHVSGDRDREHHESKR